MTSGRHNPKTPFVPALSAVFFAGLALLIAGQLVPGHQLSAALSFVGGALLVMVEDRPSRVLVGVLECIYRAWTKA